MIRALLARRTWHNLLQTMILFAGMVLLSGFMGFFIAGKEGLVWALVLGALILLFSPGLSPRVVLRMYRARPLAPAEVPALHRLVSDLSARAGLPATPTLHYIKSPLLNAFALGSRNTPALVLTDGLLRALTPREMAGVLAHELSHVANNDMWIMALADVVSRITSLFSTLGWLLLLVNLPMLLLAGYAISWVPILALVLAPTGSVLLQLALSRAREHQADLDAVALTGDPAGLAQALVKIEEKSGGLFERILLPGRREPNPSVLRTHPETEERVRRIMELAQDPAKGLPPDQDRTCLVPGGCGPATRRPRWRPGGFWY